MIWKCLPEIAPRGHFLALRAQGATAPLGPRNDKSESFTPQNAYRKSCQSAWRSASALYRGIKPQEGTGAPRAPLTCHCEERSDVAISGRHSQPVQAAVKMEKAEIWGVAALTAQPLAALPPYGFGVPIKGSARRVQEK